LQCLFSLVKNNFIFCSTAGGKRVPKGYSEPSCKYIAIDLEMKIRMVCKCEGGQSLSATARKLGFACKLYLSINTCMSVHQYGI
jgi:hypothetical protein